jgi:hypothetical protein
MHWGMVHMRFGEEVKAAMKLRKAFALLKENEQLFPAFEYNHIFSGLRDAVIGSLPGSYKWLASVFGLQGDLKKGAAQLSRFVSNHNAQQPLYGETVLYYAFVRFYLLSEQEETWAMLNGNSFPTQNNLLNTYVKVTIGLDYRKSKAALAALQDLRADARYARYPLFDYETGIALLTMGDTSCNRYLQHYIDISKSDLYLKDCWQKMAYASYIAGNMPRAEYCRQQIKLRGATRLDVDKQAQKFAEGTAWPMRKLLQARLLIDGGSNSEALAILNSINVASLTNPADKSEYYFRIGRVHQETADNNKALQYYQHAINTGKERHEQFAARAALQMGLIYEHSGMRAEARTRYKECLDMPSHDFQNSIDNQAKAGLNRLDEK